MGLSFVCETGICFFIVFFVSFSFSLSHLFVVRSFVHSFNRFAIFPFSFSFLLLLRTCFTFLYCFLNCIMLLSQSVFILSFIPLLPSPLRLKQSEVKNFVLTGAWWSTPFHHGRI